MTCLIIYSRDAAAWGSYASGINICLHRCRYRVPTLRAAEAALFQHRIKSLEIFPAKQALQR